MCTVSIIIPYFNRAETLPRALDSVLAQDYKDFEVILINDGSTDKSEQVVDEYIKKNPNIKFKHIFQENRGPSAARNNGIKNSEGQYIAFLDSDDSWEPQKLRIQIDYMNNNPSIAITGTNYFIVTDRKRSRYPTKPPVIKANFYRMLFKVFYATPTIIVRREVFFEENNWYKEGKHSGEDLLLYLQIMRNNRGVRLSIPLASIYKNLYGEGGLTDNLNRLLKNNLDNLKILYSENKFNKKSICFLLYILLYGYCYIKHLKRFLINKWHIYKKKKIRIKLNS